MAKTPTPIEQPAKSKSEERAEAEQEMLMREVDEAVRQDEVSGFAKKWGWPLGIAFGLGLAGFGGFLFWQGQSESELEAQSEAYVQAIDELEAGNTDIADGELAILAEGEGAVATLAAMLRAGIAIEDDRPAEAAEMYDAITADPDVPAELRDVATIRSVTLQFDDLDPQEVIDRVGPLAVPDNDFYGSAGELVVHAYLAQGKEDEAGALLLDLANNEDVPQSVRGRARQLAGLLGIDVIDDVDAALSEITGQELDAPAVELVE